MGKMAWDGPKWGREDFCPTNPDLADMLGRMDFDFENSSFLIFWIPNLWIFRSPDFQISRNVAWAWARDMAHPPRQLTKLGRSKELGQYRENPISASPVWGTTYHCTCMFGKHCWVSL